MRPMPWFRMFSEARTDAKLRTLSDDEHRVWFDLLCYAAERDDRGRIGGIDHELLAIEVAGGDGELLARTLAKLARLHIVESEEGAVVFTHFVDRQYDKPSDAPEATRERKRRQRTAAAPPTDPAPEALSRPSPSGPTPARDTRDTRDGAPTAAPNPLPPVNSQAAAPPSGTAEAAAPARQFSSAPSGSGPSEGAVTPGHAMSRHEERREDKRREEDTTGPRHAPARDGADSAAAAAPPTDPAPVLRLATAPKRMAEVTAAVEVAGVPLQPSGADRRAVEQSRASPVLIAEAYVAAYRGDWSAGGDGWLRENLNLRLVCDRLAGFQAWKTDPQARARASPRGAAISATAAFSRIATGGRA